MACMQALYDAADDDSATGGPDLTRRIYPVVATVTADGYQRLPEAEAGQYARAVVEERMAAPTARRSPQSRRCSSPAQPPAAQPTDSSKDSSP